MPRIDLYRGTLQAYLRGIFTMQIKGNEKFEIPPAAGVVRCELTGITAFKAICGHLRLGRI